MIALDDVDRQTARISQLRQGPGSTEFVALLAITIGLASVGIDLLLPSLSIVGASFAVANPNDLQLLVYVYIIGLGAAQLVYGPIADIIGRRPTLLASLAIFAIGCLAAILASNFAVLIAARLLQGIGGAGARVLSITIVRDRFVGREMSRLVSIMMIVYLMVPVVAPAFGEVLIWSGQWQVVFAVMLALDVLLMIWILRRLPESLHPDFRQQPSVQGIMRVARQIVLNRYVMAYSTAVGALLGCYMAYIGLAQQIFTGPYPLGSYFPLTYGLIGLGMIAGTFTNSLLVRRFGMRWLSHGGLIGFFLVTIVFVVAALMTNGKPPLILLLILFTASQYLMAMCFPNFNAMAMEPLGAVAGMGSSITGFYTTIVGVVAALLVGRFFDGSVLPLALAFTVLSLIAILSVLFAERGRLFERVGPNE